MEEKIDAMDKEALIAALSTCNEKLVELRQRSAEEVKPLMQRIKQTRTALTGFMVQHKHECIQVEDDVFLRLFHRVGSGESLTPMLFMDIVNHLTLAKFTEAMHRVTADREEALDTWKNKQRREIRKAVLANRRRRTGRLTKRQRLEAMAETAETLGADAKSNIDLIMDALPSEDVELQDVDELVERILHDLAAPEPLNRALTTKEMVTQVLLALVKERHRPSKPVVVVDSRPGRATKIETVAPRTVLDAVKAFVTLRQQVARPQQEIQARKRDYRTVMDRCKMRLTPLMGQSKFEGNLPTADGLRKITIDVVRVEKPKRRMNLTDLGEMVAASLTVPDDTPFDPKQVRTAISEANMSALIRNVLRQMAIFEASNTQVIEKIRLRRGKSSRGGLESSSDESSSDSDLD